ncbi:TRAP-T-associated universal stress protein TeaD [mine drainage metagenome]|uniref:TRAP-T-associated universal stress protein TeaD n=1 Tax=mine drainage metagenome TaxID=410659 RepID=A0A1J5P2I9_9ZZZZ
MKILLPFDGSPLALEAVKWVIRLCGEGLSTSVVLANVQEHASLYELVVAHDPLVIEQVSAAAGAHTLQAAQTLLQEAGLAYESEVATGDPAHTLVDILENYGCDLVVMGASGASVLRSAFLGSVANELLHAAAVPVMIVKAAPQSQPDVVE